MPGHSGLMAPAHSTACPAPHENPAGAGVITGLRQLGTDFLSLKVVNQSIQRKKMAFTNS